MTDAIESRDDEYYEILARHLRVCLDYKPKFGKAAAGGGWTVDQFQKDYSADPFYHWVGIDSPLMYAAHKAAGGITSIYRQLGKGGERLFQKVLQDELGLTFEQSYWTYEIPGTADKVRTLELDGRIEFAHLTDQANTDRFSDWMDQVTHKIGVPEFRETAKGVVFEVRQGYKSADSKRQNADVANAANAYSHLYVPSLALLSTQINETVALRYVGAQWLLLTGTMADDPLTSTWAFLRDVVGYDLAAFFERNTDKFRALIEEIATALLEPA